MRLKDRTCVITGGSSGIGAATVRRFVAEGAEVLIADINLEQAETLHDAGREYLFGSLDPEMV